jgi:hypothetical protein
MERRNADSESVLVRRVVEARRLTAGAIDGPAHRTAALSPHNQNATASQIPNEKDGHEPRRSFWQRLKCW